MTVRWRRRHGRAGPAYRNAVPARPRQHQVGALSVRPQLERAGSAHAAIRRYRLLTRDAPRFRSYFPTLDLIAPH